MFASSFRCSWLEREQVLSWFIENELGNHTITPAIHNGSVIFCARSCIFKTNVLNTLFDQPEQGFLVNYDCTQFI